MARRTPFCRSTPIRRSPSPVPHPMSAPISSSPMPIPIPNRPLMAFWMKPPGPPPRASTSGTVTTPCAPPTARSVPSSPASGSPRSAASRPRSSIRPMRPSSGSPARMFSTWPPMSATRRSGLSRPMTSGMASASSSMISLNAMPTTITCCAATSRSASTRPARHSAWIILPLSSTASAWGVRQSP